MPLKNLRSKKLIHEPENASHETIKHFYETVNWFHEPENDSTSLKIVSSSQKNGSMQWQIQRVEKNKDWRLVIKLYLFKKRQCASTFKFIERARKWLPRARITPVVTEISLKGNEGQKKNYNIFILTVKKYVRTKCGVIIIFIYCSSCLNILLIIIYFLKPRIYWKDYVRILRLTSLRSKEKSVLYVKMFSL